MTWSRVEREFQRLLFVVLFLGVEWRLRSSCSALPMFLRGRPRGGMLGSPLLSNDDSVSAFTLPPNMWLTQRVDHFHASDARTWKQVVQFPVYFHFNLVFYSIENKFTVRFALTHTLKHFAFMLYYHTNSFPS